LPRGYPVCAAASRLKEGQGLQLGDFKSLAAANVAAGCEVVAAHHVGLRLSEAGPVALVGVAGQLGALAADDPADLMVAGLAAMRANQGVRLLFGGFGKKIAFFHHRGQLQLKLNQERQVSFGTKFLILLFLPDPKYSILGSAMTKRKVEKFSVTKAVKSNARDQVGQPKPSRVLEDKPKPEGRESKHKTSLEELIERSEDAGE
jgi:hypothetical protein